MKEPTKCKVNLNDYFISGIVLKYAHHGSVVGKNFLNYFNFVEQKTSVERLDESMDLEFVRRNVCFPSD